MRHTKLIVLSSLLACTRSADPPPGPPPAGLVALDRPWGALTSYYGPVGGIAVGVIDEVDIDARHRAAVSVEQVISGRVPSRLEVTTPTGWSGVQGERAVFLLRAYSETASGDPFRPNLEDWKARLILSADPVTIELLTQWPAVHDGDLERCVETGQTFRRLLIDALAEGRGDTFTLAAHLAEYDFSRYVKAEGTAYKKIDIFEELTDEDRRKLNSAIFRNEGTVRERQLVFNRLKRRSLLDDELEATWTLIQGFAKERPAFEASWDATAAAAAARGRGQSPMKSSIERAHAMAGYDQQISAFVENLPTADRQRLIERMEKDGNETVRRAATRARQQLKRQQIRRERENAVPHKASP
jgi:hypothetical protein